MGTSANSEIILPHQTRSYGDSKDQEVAGIAACTLRNFPHLIERTLCRVSIVRCYMRPCSLWIFF